jgi:non-ribosomal peptide synthetase component F
LYNAFAEGKESPLPELTVQYADFAVWQRQWLQGEVLEKQLDYWKNRLAGAPPLLQLQTSRPRPAVQSFRGASQSFVLPEDLTADLRRLSRREGTTLFMTLQSAFALLLQRYSGSDDIVLGAPIAGRTQSETEQLIGLFVNLLALRIDLHNDPSFIELLHRVRQSSLEAYAHQDVPFEKLVEELRSERHMNHHPLFQVMLSFETARSRVIEIPGLTMSPFVQEGATAKLDLTLYILDAPQGLRGTIAYKTELFSDAAIRDICQRFINLLKDIAAVPEKRIGSLSLLGKSEKEDYSRMFQENLDEF